MDLQTIEQKLRELMLPVFGVEAVADVPPEASLVRDLGAESLDFVDIMYVIERNFGVVLKTKEIISGGATGAEEHVFADGKLTAEGATLLQQRFPEHADDIQPGLTKVEIYSLITVRDLAVMIHAKMEKK
jgi:acyl carrier protein